MAKGALHQKSLLMQGFDVYSRPQYPKKLFQGLQTRNPKTRRLFMAKGALHQKCLLMQKLAAFDAKMP